MNNTCLEHHDTSDYAGHNGGDGATSTTHAAGRAVLQAGVCSLGRGRANLNPGSRGDGLDLANAVGAGDGLIDLARRGNGARGNGATGGCLGGLRGSRLGCVMLAGVRPRVDEKSKEYVWVVAVMLSKS